jgi:hypothetical protein
LKYAIVAEIVRDVLRNTDAKGKATYVLLFRRVRMTNVSPIVSFRKWVLGAGIFNVVAAFPLAMPFL